jgi:uncharacterized membrane protein
MTVVLALIVLVIFVIGIAVLANVVRDEVADNFRRQRMAVEVAKATSALRRLEHDAVRQMHDVTETFIDVDGSEQ